MSEGYVEASPALDVYSSFPSAKLLKSISREPKIVVPQPIFTYVKEEERKEKKTFWDRLYEDIRSSQLTASVLLMLGQTYIVLVRSLDQLLQDRYDISIAARARYQLSEVKMPKGFLSRYVGVLALIAIVLAAVVAIMWLQPTVQPVNETVTTATAARLSTWRHHPVADMISLDADLAVKALVLATFILSLAYVFARVAQQHRMTKAMIAVMVLVDIYAVALCILGINRPLFVVTTRVGNVIVTALELFLLVKILLDFGVRCKVKNIY